MKDMHGIIFAYSSHIRLKELTERRTAASVPFGGRYRMIDFMLSNMVNAGINDVGVIMHDTYQSLLDHLGSGKDWDLARKRGGLRLLPPFGYASAHSGPGFRGRMEALYGVSSYIGRIRQEYVLMADGDLVVNLPVDEIFDFHVSSGADITCVATMKYFDDSDHTAYVRADDSHRVVDVVLGHREEGYAESLNVYILSKQLLENLMQHCTAHNQYSFRRDVLQQMTGKLNIQAYLFDGYCCHINSITNYFRHSMDLLRPEVRSQLFTRARPIKTKVRDEASTYYGPDCTVRNSVVADGCYIEGSIENCILFRGVKVESGVTVKNSILMQDTVVQKGVELNYAITDKEVLINPGRMLMGHASYPIAISKGTTV